MPRSNTKGREKRKLYGGNGEVQVSKRGNPHRKEPSELKHLSNLRKINQEIS